MNGEAETGVCIIQMLKRKEGIDAGAVHGSSKLVRGFLTLFPHIYELTMLAENA